MLIDLNEWSRRLEAVAELEKEVNEVKAQINIIRERDFWPEFISLKLLCIKCGLSYDSMRRPERRDELPNAGRRDLKIAGRLYWARRSVLSWLNELERNGERE